MTEQTLRIDQEPRLKEDQVLAWRAFARGEATPAQQRWVWALLMGELCGLTAIEPARLSERESGFLAGKRWVGMVSAKWAATPMLQPYEEEGKTNG